MIGTYESNQCKITVDKVYECDNVPVYRITSVHKNLPNKVLVRFGSEEQIKCMLNSYNALREKRFNL